MSTEADVRRICGCLEGVIERPSWNRPAWFTRTQTARMREEAVLTAKSDERETLSAADPDTCLPGTPTISPRHGLLRHDLVARQSAFVVRRH